MKRISAVLLAARAPWVFFPVLVLLAALLLGACAVAPAENPSGVGGQSGGGGGMY